MIRDLGVYFDDRLNFIVHVNNTTASALRTLGFIQRNTRSFNNIEILKSLYFSFVRAKLEYASLVWYPLYAVHEAALERIQRKFLKYLFFKCNGAFPIRGYDHRMLLQSFNITSLAARRGVRSVTYLYDLLHNRVDSPALLEHIPFKASSIITRRDVTFYCPAPRSNVLLKSPIYMICQNFNRLSHLIDINCCTRRELVVAACEHLD